MKVREAPDAVGRVFGRPRPWSLRLVPLALSLSVGFAFLIPPQAQAQAPDIRLVSYSGVGFSGSLPGVLTGLGVFHIMPERGFGLFANGHYTLGSPSGDEFFIEARTSAEARADAHLPLKEEPVYRSLSLGVIWPFDPEIAAYAGLGFTRETIFEQFEDQTQELGDFGHYWVEDPARERDGLNATAGLFIQGGRHLFFRIGGELFPRGGSLGVYWAFPG